MRYHLLSLLSCAALICAAHAYEGAPAQIVTGDRTIANAFILDESLDGIQFVLDDPRATVKSSMARKQYQRIDYGDPKDGNFKIAEILFEKGENDKALATYLKAGESATYQWVAERSQLRAAALYGRLGKPDDGIKLIDAFLAKNPKSARCADAVAQRADLRLAAGDLAGADKDFSLLDSNAEAWGGTPGRGILGRAEVLRRGKKFAEAAQLLLPVFTAMKPGTDAEAWATLGVTLADVQQAAGQKDAALATARLLVFTSATPARLRCTANLRMARCLADGAAGKTLADAFDHAVLATREDADDATIQAAKGLAKELVGRIDKDAAFADPDRKEYREYARNL